MKNATHRDCSQNCVIHRQRFSEKYNQIVTLDQNGYQQRENFKYSKKIIK